MQPAIDYTETWEEDGETYTRESCFVKRGVPVYKKEDVPPKYEFGKPFMTTVQLSKQPFPLRRMHEWYMLASTKYELSNVTFCVPEDAFWSGAENSRRAFFFEDLRALFYRERLEVNLLLIWCLLETLIFHTCFCLLHAFMA